MDETVYVEYVPPLLSFLHDHNSIVVKSGMGTGKSKSFLDSVPMFRRVIIFANRISVLRNLGQRGGITLHCDSKDIRREDKLLCTVESVHKLLSDDLSLPEPYDLVIVDELPATFSQFFSPTVKNKRRNFEVFAHIIRKAKKFAGYAADLSDIDITLIKLFRGDNVYQWTNTRQNSPGELKFEDDKDKVIETIEKSLAEGKNIYVGSDSKRLLKHLVENLDPSIKTRMYNAESSEEERKELADPVAHWKKFQLVGATPIITHGVDFNDDHFDFQVYLCSGRSIVPRVIVQSLRRVRQTKSNFTLFSLPAKLPTNNVDQSLFSTANLLTYTVFFGKLMLNDQDPLTLLANRTLEEMKTRSTMIDAVSSYWKEAGGTVSLVAPVRETSLDEIGFVEESPGVWKAWVFDGETTNDKVTPRMKVVKAIVKQKKAKLVREKRQRIGDKHKSLYTVFI